MKQIQSKLAKFTIKFFTILAILLLLIQAPSINTLILQGVINYALPKGVSVALEKTQGAFPFDIRIPTITLSDEQGKWAKIENFEYSWRGIDILWGNIHFDFVQADRLEINRLPPLPSGDGKIIHNSWPHLNIDRIHFAQVVLLPSIVPCGDSFTIQAQVESEYFAQHALTLFVEKENDKDSKKVLVTLVAKCSKEQFSLIATFIDQISSLKKYCPLMDMPITKGHASLRVKFFTDYNFNNPYFSFKGLVTDLETPDLYLADFFNGFVEWKVKVRKHQKGDPNKGIDIDHVFLRTGRQMVLNGSGSYEPETGDFRAGMRLVMPQMQQFWAMDERILAGDAATRIRVNGNLFNRTGKIDCETTGLSFYQKPLEKLALKLEGTVLPTTNYLKGDVTLSLHQGAFETFILAKLVQDTPFVWRLDAAEINAPKTKATGTALFDWTNGEIQAKFKGVVSDLAPYGELIGKPLTGKLTFESHFDRNRNLFLSADLEQWQFDLFAGDKLSLKGQIKDLEKSLTLVGKEVTLYNQSFDSLKGEYRLHKDQGKFTLEALGDGLKKKSSSPEKPAR